MPLTLHCLCHTQLMISTCFRKWIQFQCEYFTIFLFSKIWIWFIDWLLVFARKRSILFWLIRFYQILRIVAVELKSQVHTRNARQRLALPNRTKIKRQLKTESDHDRLLKHFTSRMHAQCAWFYGRKGLVSHTQASNERKSNLFTSHGSFVCTRIQNWWWARRDDGDTFRTTYTCAYIIIMHINSASDICFSIHLLCRSEP